MDEAVRSAHKKHWRNSMLIFSLTAKNSMKTKRTLFVCLGAGLIVLISVLFFFLKLSGTARQSGFATFSNLMSIVQLKVILLVLSVFYGSTVIADEIDQKTLIYLKSRPVSHFSLIMGKYMAAVLLTVFIITITTILSYFILLSADGVDKVVKNLKFLASDVGVFALGAVVYSALMLLFSIWFKRPVIWGMAFAMVWENTVVHIPGSVNNLTLLHWLQSIFPHPTLSDDLLQAFNPNPAPKGEATVVLVVLTILFLLLTWLFYRRKEYYLN